jgi:hypothetical protein
LFGLNLWGFTSILTAIVSCLFAFFLWKMASPSQVTKRFTVLLLIENVAVLTSSGGIDLLLGKDVFSETTNNMSLLHNLADVLMLTLYPLFVAYALPIKTLKPLTTVTGRIVIYSVGFIAYASLLLLEFGPIDSNIDPGLPIYILMVIMFLLIIGFSVIGVTTANTKLAKEKALAFVFAFGIRDFAWATVFLAAATGWIKSNEMFFTQLYVIGTLIYIPIMTYGILKVQMLDIEIRLKTTIKNTALAGIFVGLFYVISEGSNELLSNQLGGLIGFAASALLTLFLTPLHRWAERFSSKLVDADIDDADYADSRSLQIYSASVEETMAYGDINKGQMVLLDRLKETLKIPEEVAIKLELDLNFDRLAVQS